MKKNNNQFLTLLKKNLLPVSVLCLLLSIALLSSVSYSWFMNRRQLNTVAYIKTPIVLTIGSGNNHDIKYLDMGDIDVTAGTSADYVFCVYGEPVDIYSLQLAYTTNIAFSYDVYRAKVAGAGEVNAVSFTYKDAGGAEQTEQFAKLSDTPVISGKPLYSMTDSEIDAHQSHRLSYGDDEGNNPVSTQYVQKNAEPLYFLASEGGLNVMNPKNALSTADGNSCFCDYYILHISWDSSKVANDKETDIVYLTASR